MLEFGVCHRSRTSASCNVKIVKWRCLGNLAWRRSTEAQAAALAGQSGVLILLPTLSRLTTPLPLHHIFTILPLQHLFLFLSPENDPNLHILTWSTTQNHQITPFDFFFLSLMIGVCYCCCICRNVENGQHRRKGEKNIKWGKHTWVWHGMFFFWVQCIYYLSQMG